jgi:hypothetical protein
VDTGIFSYLPYQLGDQLHAYIHEKVDGCCNLSGYTIDNCFRHLCRRHGGGLAREMMERKASGTLAHAYALDLGGHKAANAAVYRGIGGTMSEHMRDGRLVTIVIPNKWAEAAKQPKGVHHLPAATVEYVNDVQAAGMYARSELPAKALQAYHADFYLAQVRNGGHSQFIANAGELLPIAVADALAGLEAMGAGAQHQVLSDMAAWVEANQDEARAQNGFSVRAKALDELDTRFLAADSEKPLTNLAARWIASWPELRIVEDDRYAATIEELAALNPARASRLVWANVRNLRHQLTDPLQIAMAAACGAVEPEPEIKTGIGGGFYEEIDGEDRLVFVLGTQKGERICAPSDEGARLYEYIRQEPLPDAGPDLNIEEIGNFRRPAVGRQLSEVSAVAVERFATAANETMAPEAIDLLLRKAGQGPAAMITASMAKDGDPLWIVATEGNLSIARTYANGAQLRNHEGKPLTSVTRTEIEQHAAEVAAAGLAMRPQG